MEKQHWSEEEMADQERSLRDRFYALVEVEGAAFTQAAQAGDPGAVQHAAIGSVQGGNGS